MQIPTILENLIAEHLERCENDVDRTVESILTFLTASERPMYVKDGILSQTLTEMVKRIAADKKPE